MERIIVEQLRDRLYYATDTIVTYWSLATCAHVTIYTIKKTSGCSVESASKEKKKSENLRIIVRESPFLQVWAFSHDYS